MKKNKYFILSLVVMALFNNVNFCLAGDPNEKSTIEEQTDKSNILDDIKPVVTDRFKVELTTEEDCMNLARYFKDKGVQSTFGMGNELSENEAQESLKHVLSITSLAKGVIKVFTIKNLQNEAIGQVWVKLKTDTENCISIDAWIGKPFWGQSIVPEAVCDLISQINVPNINISITLSSTNEKSKKAVLKTAEKLGAFIKNSNGEYIPQTSKTSKFYLKEKIIYRTICKPVEGNYSQINLKLYKNDVLLSEQNISKDMFQESLFKDSSGVEYIFSKLEDK